MREKRAYREDERAVSPIIGVILMVAITVVLAGVISLFVVGAGDTVQENIKAGASVTATDDDEVRVTWNNNQNANKIEVDVSGCTTGSTTLTSVGESFTTTGGPCTSGASADVVVTAIGDEDAETVIASETVEF